MPGLSQLRKFNQNLLSIGDELNVRSSRGEKPVRVKIPNDIADIDDSEEFVLGMPEIAAEVESEVVDDDLSDLMGLSKTANDKNDESESFPSFDAPDMSSILNPVIMDGDDSDGQMPDLSMFEDSPAEEVEEEEVAAEPEEISIADMGLDALLAGSGFDGSEGKAESESNSDDSDFFEDFNQAENNSDANTNLFDDIDNIEELVELDESENLGSAGDIESFNNADDLSIINDASVDGGIGDGDVSGDVADLGELGDLGDFGDIPDFNDFGTTENNAALDKIDEPGGESEVAFGGESGVEDLEALGDTSGLDGDEATNNVANDDIFKDIGLESLDSQNDFSETDDIPDYNDSIFDNDESLDDSDGNKSTEDDISLEDFDTSAMDDMDFGIADTDSKLNGGFEMGSNDDFLMEGEFEIPGFSDVSTVKDEKQAPLITKRDSKKSKKGISEVDFSEAEESEELPPNTLSDAQYKQFLKNLSEYPLNVRLAFENLIVQDEFTDDAEFEIIEKILNKAPARQVASFLEKMLDTSIPVPRDFEHRTAEEYEAYKKSLSYQLRNRIIPACLIGITLMLASFGIFQFAKNCIYKPLKANSLYKQGYALLQADEYPQSEMKFEEACKYRISKKWFFNYARGYRNHKQYQRASAMYDRILSYFKHDKAAGLEYADMELNDMANYERAEEIVRREVLDYHINDADGILKLGDIFLEWGTEKDPEKLELAREQYANLLQLYGKDQRSSDLYLSRMMRYFIRTDNLKQVIPLKKVFEPREKSLCADDWAELSGYLLDKYYGTLAPSEEYLRYEIDGLRGLLLRAVKTNPDNPIAYYNLAKYFIKSGENATIENTLQTAIEKFNTVPSMKKRDIYKYIDSYRLLGEQYIDMENYLLAQEQFSEAISLFTTERDNAGFEGNADIGKLYEDMGNIKYSISGDYDDALINYKYSVELGNDTPNLRYRIGYIQYKKNNYGEALGSFMKAGDGNVKERNLMLAMANTLFMRGDDYAAQGYYSQLIDSLDREIEKRGIVFPQTSVKDYDVVNTYLYASNNYGVTLYNLAKRTGNSALNAQAIVQFSQSLRAWDALTRNQETLVRLEGSNLAQQNIQYITHQVPEFEPSIYTEISKTLLDNEKL